MASHTVATIRGIDYKKTHIARLWRDALSLSGPPTATENAVTKSFRFAYFPLPLVCMFALIMIATPAAQAQTLTVLHHFTGQNDGARPGSGMTMDRAGNFYGSTAYGGDWSCDLAAPGGGGPPPGCGVLFKARKNALSWVVSPLYVFPGKLQGYLPDYPGGLAIGPNGSLYGIKNLGGTDGNGSVFNTIPAPVAPSSALSQWNYSVLYQFTGGNDGGAPTRLAPLLFDAAGNIFGAATYGGPTDSGVVYEMTLSGSAWTETPLYSFTGGSDGKHLRGITFDEEGNIYGVAAYGGGNEDCGFNYGCGTVYKLTHSQSGWTETTLHAFQQGVDGGWPGPLIRDKAGNLYGITEQSGPVDNGGTVWEMSPSSGGGWTFSVIHAFPTTTVDDYGPYALTMDAAGNLYGITNWGGYENLGFLFKLAPSNGNWTYTELYDFGTAAGQLDGCTPQGAPLLDAAGNIYGVTEFCGRYDLGTIWEFTP